MPFIRIYTGIGDAAMRPFAGSLQNILSGALLTVITESLLILPQFYVQIEGQIQDFFWLWWLWWWWWWWWWGGGGGKVSKFALHGGVEQILKPHFLQSDAFCDPFDVVPKGRYRYRSITCKLDTLKENTFYNRIESFECLEKYAF